MTPSFWPFEIYFKREVRQKAMLGGDKISVRSAQLRGIYLGRWK